MSWTIASTNPIVQLLQQFNDSTWLGFDIPISNPGGLNVKTVNPTALGENFIGSSDLPAMISSGGDTHIGQVFKVTPDETKFDHMRLRLDVEALPIRTEDFESYADTTALRVAWLPSDVPNSPNTLDTVIFDEGAKSMAMAAKKNQSAGDTFTLSFGAEDWSDQTDVILSLLQTDSDLNLQLRVRIGDGTNSKSITLMYGIDDVGTWVDRAIMISNMVEDGAGTTDMSAITTIEFEHELEGVNGTIYVDDIRVAGVPGTVDVELWSFGSTAAPTLFSQGSLVTTVTDMELFNNPDRSYVVEFSAVQILNANEYYAWVITNASVASTTTKSHGTTAGTYVSGDAMTSSDGVNLTQLTGQDLYFETFFRMDGAISIIQEVWNGDPVDSQLDVFLESTDFIDDFAIHREVTKPGILVYDSPLGRPMEISDIEGVRVQVAASGGIVADSLLIRMLFLFTRPRVNG